MKKLILIVIFVLVLILFFSLFLSADVYVKVVERTEAFEMPGKRIPEKVEIKEQWLAKDKFAYFSKDLSIIVDYKKEKLYFIINKHKKYYEFPINIDMAKLQELLPPKVAEIISSIKITDVKVNLGGQKKKVANWDCRETEFEMVIMVQALNIMPKYKTKFWTTKDIPFDHKDYSRGISEFYERFVFRVLNVDENSKKEIKKMDKIEGFHVASEVIVNMFGTEIKVESQALEVTEKPAPAGIYSVPKDYTKGNLNVDLGLQKKSPEKKSPALKENPDKNTIGFLKN
ncbi:MAG: hypothetical protein GTN73_09995 [Candidatus Aminicenantes bacterium]|nr:hypothetical protein [Candidatus Aminicenantes bacterium]